VAALIYAAGAFEDLERIYRSLAEDDPTLAANSVRLIRDAIHALEHTPMLGRPAEGGLRERVISRGRTGYVALYRFHELDDTVLVLSIRHRREAGYPSTE
jgi:plasmid stabilization system protein ParE